MTADEFFFALLEKAVDYFPDFREGAGKSNTKTQSFYDWMREFVKFAELLPENKDGDW